MEPDTTSDLLGYLYIDENHFGALMIMQQRIRNPNAVGIDPYEFSLNRQLYRQAQTAGITSDILLFEKNFREVFSANALYSRSFP
ncbi:MAG TPA: hypothetical protein DDW19_06200 [Anaerolineaceae bacterium]|jgi:hypothetical protein|nr:hypothetical protein [Anaerolineaceae bacterium]